MHYININAFTSHHLDSHTLYTLHSHTVYILNIDTFTLHSKSKVDVLPQVNVK